MNIHATTPRASTETVRRVLTKIAHASGRERISEPAVNVWAESLAGFSDGEIHAAGNRAITMSGPVRLGDIHRIIGELRGVAAERPDGPGLDSSGNLTPEAMAWSIICQEVRERGPAFTPKEQASVAAHLLRQFDGSPAGGRLDAQATKRAVRDWLAKFDAEDWAGSLRESFAPSSGRTYRVDL